MGLTVAGPDGKPVVPHMGSYGIGVSRLVGAIIEASHDDAGIIWPDAVAPWKAAMLNLKPGDKATRRHLRGDLRAASAPTLLYDDRDERAGVKFADADLMGHPWQIVVGPRGAAAGRVELKRRAERRAGRAHAWPTRSPASAGTAAMFNAFERAVAGRYLRARRGERFVSVIAIFSLSASRSGWPP